MLYDGVRAMIERWDVYDDERRIIGRMDKGAQMVPGTRRLAVHVWIQNGRGEYLIGRRAAEKPGWPGLWECTAGAAIAGEDGLQAALRETREELGIELDPAKGEMIRAILPRTRFWMCGCFCMRRICRN